MEEVNIILRPGTQPETQQGRAPYRATYHNTPDTLHTLMLSYHFTFLHGTPNESPGKWSYYPVYLPADDLSEALAKWNSVKLSNEPGGKFYEYRQWLVIRAVCVYRLTNLNRLAALQYEPVTVYLQTAIDTWQPVEFSSVRLADSQPRNISLYE